jgi:hypothetical protein
VRCFSCGALVPDIDEPTHSYMKSSPGCWKVFGEVLAREYSDYFDPDIHGLTVDTYAVQHPGDEQPVTIQSVNGHLLRLYFALEKGTTGASAAILMKAIMEDQNIVSRFTWLEPPSFDDTMHVTDVVKATDFEGHKRAVQAWADSVWNAWREKHFETIKSLAGGVFED